MRVERVAHCGVMAAVIQDGGRMDLRDARLRPDRQEESPPGAAVAGMRRNGWGCAKRPFSFTPQLFATNPLDWWFHEGVQAALCNRLKRGRTLAAVDTDGGARLLRDLALAIGRQEGLARRCQPLDTTSLSRTGEDVADRDAHAMVLTQGDSPDPRPDLHQAGLARRVSPDGGGPLRSQRGDGHTAATPMCQERVAALLATCPHAPPPRDVVADSQLSTADNAPNLPALGCITRRPNPLKRVAQVITQARQGDRGQRWDDTTREHPVAWCHYRMAQRWLVVCAPAALDGAEARGTNAHPRE